MAGRRLRHACPGREGAAKAAVNRVLLPADRRMPRGPRWWCSSSATTVRYAVPPAAPEADGLAGLWWLTAKRRSVRRSRSRAWQKSQRDRKVLRLGGEAQPYSNVEGSHASSSVPNVSRIPASSVSERTVAAWQAKILLNALERPRIRRGVVPAILLPRRGALLRDEQGESTSGHVQLQTADLRQGWLPRVQDPRRSTKLSSEPKKLMGARSTALAPSSRLLRNPLNPPAALAGSFAMKTALAATAMTNRTRTRTRPRSQ